MLYIYIHTSILHKQIHIHKGIWDGRLHTLLCSLLQFLSLVLILHMGYLNFHYPQSISVYSTLIQSYSYDYEQLNGLNSTWSNLLSSTLPCSRVPLVQGRVYCLTCGRWALPGTSSCLVFDFCLHGTRCMQITIWCIYFIDYLHCWWYLLH